MVEHGSQPAVIRAVHRYLTRHVARGSTILVALSGGPDSTCLALALAELAQARHLTLRAVCVDHGLRAGSAAEAERVAAWAGTIGIPCEVVRVQVGREGGLEAAAREARYAALEQTAKRVGADWIATGHTATDQAETVLLRLGRGSGARGAGGILAKRGRVIRPLLEVSRDEVLAYLAGRGVKAQVEDPTNLDLDRARNRIRHRVLPELRQALGPGVDRALVRFAAFAREDEAALREMACLSNPCSRDALEILPPPVQRRWVREACEELGYRPNASDLLAVSRFLAKPGSGRLELARRVELLKTGKLVHLGAVRQPEAAEPVQLEPGKPVELPWAGLRLELRRASPALAVGPDQLALPLDVALPLRARPRQPGDRIRPLGGGSRKLKRLLIDAKVDRSERERLVVVEDARGQVLWVVGVRVAEAARAGQGAPEGYVLHASSLGTR